MVNKIEKIAYIIGMPRAGTTFLYHNLNKHPKLYVPFRRKTNYFSLHRDKTVEWFLEHFKEMPTTQVGIDTETLFFSDKNLKSYKNIKEMNPNAKVMLFVRSPDDWAYSFYKQIATFDKNIVPFEEFLNGDYVLVEDAKEVPFNIKDGDIENIIEDIRKEFGSNLLMIDFRLFKNDPLRLLQTIEKFLEIDNFFTNDNFQNKKINASNRGHVTFLANLLREQWLIDVLSKMPPSFVKTLRLAYDNLSSHLSKNQVEKNDTVSDELLLAQKYFPNDIKYYNNLFKDVDTH